MWAGFVWPRIRTGGRLLWTRYGTFESHNVNVQKSWTPLWRRTFVLWRLILASTLYGSSIVAFPALRIMRWILHCWKICRPLPLRTKNLLINRWTNCFSIRLHSLELVSQLIIYFASQIRLFYNFVAFIWQRKGKSSSPCPTADDHWRRRRSGTFRFSVRILTSSKFFLAYHWRKVLISFG